MHAPEPAPPHLPAWLRHTHGEHRWPAAKVTMMVQSAVALAVVVLVVARAVNVLGSG